LNPFNTIATFDQSSELLVIRSRLEAEGIECFSKDELTVQVNNFYSNAIGGIKLQVRQSDFDKAIEILKSDGYETVADTQQSSFWTKFNGITEKIPLLNRTIPEIRLVILVLIVIIPLILVLIFAS